MSGDFQKGLAIRRDILGGAHVDRAQAATTSFTAPFQDYITRNVWGDVCGDGRLLPRPFGVS